MNNFIEATNFYNLQTISWNNDTFNSNCCEHESKLWNMRMNAKFEERVNNSPFPCRKKLYWKLLNEFTVLLGWSYAYKKPFVWFLTSLTKCSLQSFDANAWMKQYILWIYIYISALFILSLENLKVLCRKSVWKFHSEQWEFLIWGMMHRCLFL